LLVALHGTGGHGSQYIHVWLPWVKKREDVILAAPSIVGEPWGGSRTAHSHVLTLVKELTREFAIDHDRVFLGGMSMGGYAAFRIGCFRADRFAGLICRVHGPIFKPPGGQSARKDGANLVPRFLENLSHTPLYWIVGQMDPGISIDLMRRGHERLKELKYDVTFREKPGGHEAYLDENDNLLQWMDQHQRDPYPAEVVFHTNRPDYNRLWWVEISRFAGRPPASVKTLDFEGKPAGTRQEYLEDAIVTAKLDRPTNTVTAQTRGVQQLAISLDDKMLNLDAPVRIVVNGRVLWNKPVRRSLPVLLEDARQRGDRSMVFSARVVLNIP
jgi:predicted esterase